MPSHRRDAALAGGLLAVLLAAVLGTVGAGPLVHPLAVGGGVGAALAAEAAFLRYPATLLAAWERRGVAAASAVALGALAAGAVAVAPWLVGAAVWGLVTYLALLGCVLVGVGNPVAVVVEPVERE